MRKNCIAAACLLLLSAAALAVWCLLTRRPQADSTAPSDASSTAETEPRRIAGTRTNRPKRSAARTRAESGKPSLDLDDDELASFSPDERKVAERIQGALDDDDYRLLLPAIEAAAKSANAALREKAVEALSWFGKKALPELTLFMADPNDDIRSAACDAWIMALPEIDDDRLRGETVLSAMKVVRDRDELDRMVTEITDLPNVQQLPILIQLIGGPNAAAAAAAREHYEFVTGDAYESVETAQKWLDENPDDAQ